MTYALQRCLLKQTSESSVHVKAVADALTQAQAPAAVRARPQRNATRALSSFRGFSSGHAEPIVTCSAPRCALSLLPSCASPTLRSCSALIHYH